MYILTHTCTYLHTCLIVSIFHPALSREAMHNTSFIILLQEICNTWNRMQYAVYLHVQRARGSAVASVCDTGAQEGEETGGSEHPNTSWQSIIFPERNYSPRLQGRPTKQGKRLRKRRIRGRVKHRSIHATRTCSPCSAWRTDSEYPDNISGVIESELGYRLGLGAL